MSSLRSAAIKLAHSNPGPVRKALLSVLAAASPQREFDEILDTLGDLKELRENVQEVIDGFNLHYAFGRKSGGMNPEIYEQTQLLSKTQEGAKLAAEASFTLEKLVKSFPDNPKFAKTLADARKLEEDLRKQAAAAGKILTTLAKKVAPKALLALSKKVESAIRAMLVDDSSLTTRFRQQSWRAGDIDHFFVIEVQVPHTDEDGKPWKITAGLTLRESTVGKPGVFLQGHGDPQWEPATVDAALAVFKAQTKGWDNVKGSGNEMANRAIAARGVADALDRALRRFGGVTAKISGGGLSVEASYRSDLPKGGASEVGEYEYEEMVEVEIARAQKAVTPALEPFKSSIEKVQIEDGEKSWIYVNVILK